MKFGMVEISVRLTKEIVQVTRLHRIYKVFHLLLSPVTHFYTNFLRMQKSFALYTNYIQLTQCHIVNLTNITYITFKGENLSVLIAQEQCLNPYTGTPVYKRSLTPLIGIAREVVKGSYLLYTNLEPFETSSRLVRYIWRGVPEICTPNHCLGVP